MSYSEDFIKIIKNMRKYSNFFDWPEKSLKERGIVEHLLESMRQCGETSYANPRSCSDQWPDVLVKDQLGGEVGVEVTELVDETSVRENQQGNGIYCIWKPAEIKDEIEKILAKKDLKSNRGGKYTKIVLLIHTDELTVEPEKYIPLIKTWSFKKPEQINEAFLLFSYDPRTKTYPYVRLPF